jgi:hypothetical protein
MATRCLFQSRDTSIALQVFNLQPQVINELDCRFARLQAQGECQHCQWTQLQPLAELVKLVQRNAAVTAFKLTQVRATRFTEVALRDVSLASKRPEYGGERRLQ